MKRSWKLFHDIYEYTYDCIDPRQEKYSFRYYNIKIMFEEIKSNFTNDIVKKNVTDKFYSDVYLATRQIEKYLLDITNSESKNIILHAFKDYINPYFHQLMIFNESYPDFGENTDWQSDMSIDSIDSI
jgi:hypothetical protein